VTDQTSADGGQGTAEGEVPSLAEVLAATPTRTPDPPIASPQRLPIDQLDSRMAERLVAEVAMRVEGLPHVRIYGRSGQGQGGLDLYAGPVGQRTVYQVKREVRLSATMLRNYVREYAGPSRRPDGTIGDAQPNPRRKIEATRYVLAASACIEDTAVEDELDRLQSEYAGDLDIELWDGHELSRMLRDRGPLVAGIFGPDWARVFSGYHPLAGDPIPHGRALLNDPIVIHGLSAQRDRAASLADTDPAAAAELYGELATRLAGEGFAVLSTQLRHRRRDLLEQASEIDAAITATLELLLDAHDVGQRSVHEVGPFSTLARLTGTSAFVPRGPRDAAVPAEPDTTSETADPDTAPTDLGTDPTVDEPEDPVVAALVITATAITTWADRGYEVAPVAEALQTLADADHPLTARLAAAVAEQVIADDDPVDPTDRLSAAVEAIAPTRPAGLVGVRLYCAAADLAVRAGTPPSEAFHLLLRRARTAAFIDPGHEALALRRAGYAHAAAGLDDDAVELFQGAVLSSSEAHLGGDTRDSLRAVADITHEAPTEIEARTASTATGNDARVLTGADQAALSTLEHLADDHQHAALARALFEGRTWQRIERASGAWVEETIAHRRHAQVLLRADERAAAVVPLIRARQHDLAANTARGVAWIDVTRFLRGNPDHRRAACTVATAQADLTPGDHVSDLGAALADIVATGPIDPAKDALRALAALGRRLPPNVADLVAAFLAPSITREVGVARYGDQEVLLALGALARYPSEPIADRAAGLLVEALAAGVHGAANRLVALPPVRVDEIEALAEQDHRDATAVLAWWQHPHPSIAAAARRGAHALLAHPIGPQTSHSIGTSAQDDAQALRCAVTHDIPEPAPAPEDAGDGAGRLADLVAPVVAHLLDWAGDPHDLAPSRAEALLCLRVLRDLVPEQDRDDPCRRLLAVADHPDLSPDDLASQASTGPLSYFRFDLGSEHLAADALVTAALYATTPDEGAAVAERLIPALRGGVTDEQDAEFRAATLQELERLHPLPFEGAAEHPAVAIRAVVATLWGGRHQRSTALARRLAADPEPRVRLAVARALVAVPPDAEDAPDVAAALAPLSTDPSAAVRYAARETVGPGLVEPRGDQ